MSRFKAVMSGEASQKIAIFWFTLLGFIGAITTVEVVGIKIDSLPIVIVSKLSYIFLFLWLQASINQAIWWALPSYNPDLQQGNKEESHKKMWRGGRWSAIACILIYLFITHVVQAVVCVQNA